MKKLLLLLTLAVFAITGMSQTMIIIQGTVYDSVTNNVVPNHPVTILADSSGGFFYFNTVSTSMNGWYCDTIIPNTGVYPSYVYARTYDCQITMHQVVIQTNPATTNYTADFWICTGSASPCQASFFSQQSSPLVVSFLDASVNGTGTWFWNFGDGNTSSLQDPVHIFSQAGYYTVSLTIGALGTPCYSTSTQTIYVWDSITSGCQANFYIVPDSMNTTNTFYFFDLSVGTPETYIWNLGDGTIQVITFPASPNIMHTYAQPGTYTPCLTIMSADSTCYDMTCQTLVVGPPQGCQANFTYYADSNIVTNTLHFIDLSIGSNLTWSWSFGDGTGSTQQHPVHTFPNAGYYLVSLTITSQNPACTSTFIDSVYVGGGAGCQANFTYQVNPISGNHTVYFTDLSFGNPTAWFWSFGDGTSATEQNPAHTYNAPGTYNVCLTISGNNCQNTYCQNVTVSDTTNYQQIYGQVFAGNFPIALGMAMIFSVDSTGTFTPFVDVCPIDSNGIYYFSAVPQGDYYIMAVPLVPTGFLPTYYGNTISWEQATVITLGTANNPYNINVLPSDQMTPGPGSASGQINMGDVSTAMLDKINMIIMNEQGNPIGFTTVSTTGAFNFPSLAYGTYYLHPEMPGVTSDVVKVVLTAEQPHADVVMTFTGNNIMGTRDEPSLVTEFRIFPNPVRDQVNLSLNLKQEVPATITVLNTSGQTVWRKETVLQTGTSRFSIPVSGLPVGIYTLSIFSQDGVNVVSKIVVAR